MERPTIGKEKTSHLIEFKMREARLAHFLRKIKEKIMLNFELNFSWTTISV